jgi:hypothetical protein
MYDEKAKQRITRCLKTRYEQIRLTVPKGTLALYKAYAASRGVSMTALIRSLVEDDMRRNGFDRLGK